MNREDRNLLLADISARLPYGVVVRLRDQGDFGYIPDFLVTGISDKGAGVIKVEIGTNETSLENVIPYLRRPTDLTVTEKERLLIELYGEEDADKFTVESDGCISGRDGGSWFPAFEPGSITRYITFMDKHYIDHRGLIEKGLAVEAKPEIYYSV